eukprot:6338624-Pyramimonas_sp.AAC.1
MHKRTHAKHDINDQRKLQGVFIACKRRRTACTLRIMRNVWMSVFIICSCELTVSLRSCAWFDGLPRVLYNRSSCVGSLRHVALRVFQFGAGVVGVVSAF